MLASRNPLALIAQSTPNDDSISELTRGYEGGARVKAA